MEARHCLIRRAGSDSRPKTVVGFCVSGLYCAKQFRGNHMATDMMLNLLAPFKGHEVNNKSFRFAKIYDEEAHFVPYAYVLCANVLRKLSQTGTRLVSLDCHPVQNTIRSWTKSSRQAAATRNSLSVTTSNWLCRLYLMEPTRHTSNTCCRYMTCNLR